MCARDGDGETGMAKSIGSSGGLDRPTSPVMARLRREDAMLTGCNADRLEWLRTRQFFAEHSLVDALEGLALMARPRPAGRRRAAAAAAAATAAESVDKPRRPHAGVGGGCGGKGSGSSSNALMVQHLIGLNKEKKGEKGAESPHCGT